MKKSVFRVKCLFFLFCAFSLLTSKLAEAQNTDTQRREYVKQWKEKALKMGVNFDTSLVFNPQNKIKYLKVNVWLQDQSTLEQIARLGIETEHTALVYFPFPVQVSDKKGVVLEISEKEFEALSKNGFVMQILCPDLCGSIPANTSNHKNEPELLTCYEPKKYQTPKIFQLGTMGGHFAYLEVLQHLDTLAKLYPDLISPRFVLDSSIKTHQRNYIYGVRVSNNSDIKGKKPKILYTGLHHAREPVSIANLIFYLDYLLENYGKDSIITEIIDKVELHFVPVINPDGYIYNQLNQPNGGGMWRKNLYMDANNNFIGVDLNRNYGYEWGKDNTGSSDDPINETYRGVSAFSEPETRIIKQYCEKNQLATALNYHSYGNSVFSPFNFTTDNKTPDSLAFAWILKLLTQNNHYSSGTVFGQLGYYSNGTSDDWMYGGLPNKKIFAFTPEIGFPEFNNPVSSFWPPKDKIIPYCEANLEANILAARALIDHVEVIPQIPLLLDAQKGLVFQDSIITTKFNVIDDNPFSQDQTIYFDKMSMNISTLTNQISVFRDEPSFKINKKKFELILKPDIKQGGQVKYQSLNTFKTVNKQHVHYWGMIDTIFKDSFTSLDNWQLPDDSDFWNIDTKIKYSGESALSDRLDNQMVFGNRGAIITNVPISLKNAFAAELSFNALWNFQSIEESMVIEISTDKRNYTTLCSDNLSNGSKFQLSSNSVLGGIQKQWKKIRFDLTPYIKNDITLRLRVLRNKNSRNTGVTIDDFQIAVIQDTTVGINEQQLNKLACVVYGNPSNSNLTLEFAEPLINQNRIYTFKLWDVTGRLVFSSKIENIYTPTISFDLSDKVNGVYYYQIEDNLNNSGTGKWIKY